MNYLMTNDFRIYVVASYGIAALWLLGCLGGFWICVVNRKLSSRLMIAALGFIGLFGAIAVERIILLDMDHSSFAVFSAHLVSSGIGCIALIVLVFGLGATVVDLRRQLSRALDPDYAVDEPLGEFGLIDWIRRQSQSAGGTSLGIGDDCAGLRFSPGAEVLVTTDMLMDGRHFHLGEATAGEIGYKALAVNLSDIAAMAGVPVAAFVAVALPRRSAVEVAQGLHAGMLPLLERFGVSLAGGDTNAWDGPLVVTVTLLGESTARGAVRRSGAKPGDSILVTGPLGGSLSGRHLRPMPRITEALVIAEVAEIHAMIDISDGLAADLGHILEESGGLGAILDAKSIPIHEDARTIGGDSLSHALHDGEDFELCLTLDQDEANRLLQALPPGVMLYQVGTIETKPGLRLVNQDGSIIELAAKGFDHLATSG